MLRYENKGYTIEISLSIKRNGFGYSVVCNYIYNRDMDNYSLTMYLKNETIDNLYEIGTNDIKSSRETIKTDICKIVENGCKTGFFDKHIENCEYEQKCFLIGNNVVEEGDYKA